jgi:7-cyano-7-deazaguanine synthase
MDHAPKILCLMSGGLDSAVTAAIAACDYQVVGLHFSYGQRGEAREKACFQALTGFFRCKEFFNFTIPIYSSFSGSSLTDKGMAIPIGNPIPDRIPTTYVPFRNGVMLSLAAAVAESLHISHIFIGAVWEDSSGYPDCREEFLKAMETAIHLGTKPETKIVLKAPLIHKTKSEIVTWGGRLNTPFNLTWSCYHDQPRPCGECESCVLRQKGFREAGIPDPLLSI